MAAYICSRQISVDIVLPEPPLFLRFDVVSVNYCRGEQPIASKCESVKKLLLPLASALNGAKLEFDGRFDRTDLSDFSDHSTLLSHLSNDLPISNNCRAYEFRLRFLSEKTAQTVISSILEMGPARNCANVKFVIFGTYQPTALPVEAITNWFFHNVAEDRKRKIREKKSIEIRMNGISNGPEIQTRLKEANHGFYFIIESCHSVLKQGMVLKAKESVFSFLNRKSKFQFNTELQLCKTTPFNKSLNFTLFLL